MVKTRQTNKTKVSYEHPPLIEVVCGVQFEAVPQLTIGHLGILWSHSYRDYNECVEMFPLSTPLDDLPENRITNAPTEKLPQMPRCGLIASDNSAIIQIQRDAFYYNWQKKDESTQYPRYEAVMKNFDKEFGAFNSFIGALGGAIKPVQYELTYLNEVPIKPEYDGMELFRDVRWISDPARYLPDPELVSIDCSFVLPNGLGRLRNQFKNVLKLDGNPALQWSLCVRGATQPRAQMATETMRGWFDEARTCIVRSFEDLADERFQRDAWGKVE